MRANSSSTAKKTVNAANLAALGAARLADLLIEAAGADASLKRRLRMELAAEVGAPDLALTTVAIETLTTVLFVLVLRHLPVRFVRRASPQRAR